jgi:hypothetical protein
MKSSSPWGRIYLGVALTTLATLLLELALTRIFSVVFYYHFAFLAISIALFGLGAGGVFSYVAAGWKGTLFSKLGDLAVKNALCVIAALVFVLTRPPDPSNLSLALVYFFCALPFFLSGAIVSLAVSETIERINRVYFFDLIGAAAGCLLLIPLLEKLGGPNTVIAAGAISGAAGVVWFGIDANRKGRNGAILVTAFIVALIGYNLRWPIIDVKYAKGQVLHDERFVKWNTFSRIGLTQVAGTQIPLIVIDGDASTGIPGFDLDRLAESERRDLLYQGPGLPYDLRPGAKTLIIGAGGGWDVARALASGSHDITGVEINPIIANTIMRERFPRLSRGLYLRPEVRIVVEDGRSFVRRSPEKYQVLQATLVDTWASTAAGAFALSENNLYTTDAFYDYLSHLTDDGLLAFTRWGFEPPRESLRLLSLSMDALARLGERDPASHIMVARANSKIIGGWGATDTVLISRKPFTAADVIRGKEAIAKANMDAVYLPGDKPVNPFGQLLHAANPAAFQSQYRFDISPVNDNRPFFFYTVQPRDLWDFVKHASDNADYKINRAVPLLFGLIVVSFLAVAVILALPRLLLGARLPRQKGILRFLSYFIAIGVGYILIQVALVQKFVLFLGHPTYALTVIIFSMLISSGIGSYFSQRIVGGSDTRLQKVLLFVAIAVSALAFLVTPLLSAGVAWPLPLKFLVSVVVIAPAGFLMGMPFPSGLRRLEERHHPSVRWAWALNAAASVMGSVSAIVLAIYLGLRETMLVGAGIYLCALVAVRLTREAQRVEEPVLQPTR